MVLQDDQDGRGEGGGGGPTGRVGGVREAPTREGMDMYTQLTQFPVQKKLTEECKAVILQLKKEKNKGGGGGEKPVTDS